jgi:uncharacterized protein YjbJ (UPF0337 family)
LTIFTTSNVALFRDANSKVSARTTSRRYDPTLKIPRLNTAASARAFRRLAAGTSSEPDGFPSDRSFGGTTMDWNRVEGNWKQTKGKIKEKWGQLTDDDLTQINGKREQLEGKIQERYGVAKDKVRKDIDDWLKTMH